MRKRMHPADAADLAAIREASYFVASIFLGTGQYDTHAAPTLANARAVAAQMTTHYRNGRIASVYAILPSGAQVIVPASYQPDGETHA